MANLTKKRLRYCALVGEPPWSLWRQRWTRRVSRALVITLGMQSSCILRSDSSWYQPEPNAPVPLNTRFQMAYARDDLLAAAEDLAYRCCIVP
jgi:hypothetical protein